MGTGRGGNRRTINSTFIPFFVLVVFGANSEVHGLPVDGDKVDVNVMPSNKNEQPEESQKVAQNELRAGNKADTSGGSVGEKSNDQVPSNEENKEGNLKIVDTESGNADKVNSTPAAPKEITETAVSGVSSKLSNLSNDSPLISPSKINEAAPESASSAEKSIAELESRPSGEADESMNQKKKTDQDIEPSAKVVGSDSFNNLVVSSKTSDQKNEDPSSVNGSTTSQASWVVAETNQNVPSATTVAKEQQSAVKVFGNLNPKTDEKKVVDKIGNGQSEVDMNMGEALMNEGKNREQMHNPHGSSHKPNFPLANSKGWSLARSKNAGQIKNSHGFVFKAMGEPSFHPQDQSTQSGLHGIALEYLLMLLCVILIAILLVWRKFWYTVCTTWFPRSQNQNVPINAYKVGYRPLNRK